MLLRFVPFSFVPLFSLLFILWINRIHDEEPSEEAGNFDNSPRIIGHLPCDPTEGVRRVHPEFFLPSASIRFTKCLGNVECDG